MKQYLEKILQEAVAHLADHPEPIVLERPRDPTHGDWSSPIALVLAKSMHLPPRSVAENIVALLPQEGTLERITIAGPGFINFSLSRSYLNAALAALWSSPTCGVAQTETPITVVIDYSSPNLAKEMHVGHLRSTIIGDAIARILAFQGQHVIRQNHIGDWGTQFGMLLAYLHTLKQGVTDDWDLHDIDAIYQAAKQRFDASPAFADEARAWVVKLQNHDPATLFLWQRFIALSQAHCQAIYERLQVDLSPKDVRAESAYNDDLPEIVATLAAQELLSDQEGTKCVFLDQFIGKDQRPLPIIVQKKDGAYLYATTDLAALRYRQNVLRADRILYVVDARQALHFEQIFALGVKAGLVSAQLEHVAFGMILDKAGRPFKSREGGVTKLIDVLDEAERRAQALIASKNPTLSHSAQETMAKIIAIAAVKYADLSKNRNSDYVFDWDTMLSFEGNTAPYLLYANTRIHSLMQKAQTPLQSLDCSFDVQDGPEITLAKQLLLFPEVISIVADKAMPHLLCTYLYELAVLFSHFYENCPVLNTKDKILQNQRLKLAGLTSRILEQGLGLLGIRSLQKM